MKDWKELAIPLVASFEGCHKIKGNLVYPYLDKLAKPNVWTIGYGLTVGITEDTPPISKDKAKTILGLWLEQYAAKVLRISPVLSTRQHSLAAVVSWAYNCGVGAFKVSRLRRAINSGDWNHAAELIKRPTTAGGVVYNGLVRRRMAESLVFSGYG